MSSPNSMSPMSPMSPQQREDVQRDVAATLEARRELGPGYDDHFVQSLTERMMAQVRHEMARTPAAPKNNGNKLSPGHRLALAICSLGCGIPLIAIAGAYSSIALFAVIVMIALVNLFAAF